MLYSLLFLLCLCWYRKWWQIINICDLFSYKLRAHLIGVFLSKNQISCPVCSPRRSSDIFLWRKEIRQKHRRGSPVASNLKVWRGPRSRSVWAWRRRESLIMGINDFVGWSDGEGGGCREWERKWSRCKPRQSASKSSETSRRARHAVNANWYWWWWWFAALSN